MGVSLKSDPNLTAAPPITQNAPVITASTSWGGSYATAFDGAETNVLNPTISVAVNQIAGDHPPYQAAVATAAAASPEDTCVVQLPTPEVSRIVSAPSAFVPVEEETQDDSWRTTSAGIKSTITIASKAAVQPPNSSPTNYSSSSGTHLTTLWQAPFFDEWKRDSTPPTKQSDNLSMSRRLSHSYGDFVKNFNRRKPIVLWVTLLVVALVGISAGFVTYAKRNNASPFGEEYDAEIDTDRPPWMFGPWSKTEAAARDHTTVVMESPCQSPLCSKQVVKLVRSLDHSVPPCSNFYGHVCSQRGTNGTVDEQLAQLTEFWLLSFFKGIGSPDKDLPVASASRRLWKDCVDLVTLSRQGKAPLQELLKLTGLGGWPYGHTGALPDVWKAAGDLLRLMAVAPLFDVDVLTDGTVRLSPGELGGSDRADDVADAMLAVRRNSSALRGLAEDVADLGRRLSGLRDHQRASDAAVVPRPFLEAALRGVKDEVGLVRAEPEGFAAPLVQLVRESSPQVVLNLLGYRLVRHVDVFTPAAVKTDLYSGAVSSRESRCARVVLHQALTGDAAEYVRYAALRSQLDFDLVRSMEVQLKHALDDKLAKLAWLDEAVRKNAQARLRALRVRFFFDRYEGTNGSAQSRPPAALPSHALATYQRFRQARFRSRLLQGPAEDDMGEPHCSYDAGYQVLFVRLSAVDLRDPQSPLWPALQAAYFGPRLARCMLRVLLPDPDGEHHQGGRRVHWSPATLRHVEATRACLRDQHARVEAASPPWSTAQETLALVDSGALGPARDVFDAYVARMADGAAVTEPAEGASGKPLKWHQVFYAAYAHSMCDDPDRHWQHLAQRTPRWERVNGPLSNDLAFQQAFECRRGSRMRAETPCSFWRARH